MVLSHFYGILKMLILVILVYSIPKKEKKKKKKSIYQVQGVLPERIQILFFKTLFNEKI